MQLPCAVGLGNSWPLAEASNLIPFRQSDGAGQQLVICICHLQLQLLPHFLLSVFCFLLNAAAAIRQRFVPEWWNLLAAASLLQSLVFFVAIQVTVVQPGARLHAPHLRPPPQALVLLVAGLLTEQGGAIIGNVIA